MLSSDQWATIKSSFKKKLFPSEERSQTLTIQRKGLIKCLGFSFWFLLIRGVWDIFSLAFQKKQQKKNKVKIMYFMHSFLSFFHSWEYFSCCSVAAICLGEAKPIFSLWGEGLTTLIRQQKKTKAPPRSNLHTNNRRRKKNTDQTMCFCLPGGETSMEYFSILKPRLSFFSDEDDDDDNMAEEKMVNQKQKPRA